MDLRWRRTDPEVVRERVPGLGIDAEVVGERRSRVEVDPEVVGDGRVGLAETEIVGRLVEGRRLDRTRGAR